MHYYRYARCVVKTLLICHEDDTLNRRALPRWMASFSELAGIVSIREVRTQKRARVRRELKRLGAARFVDVLAFRIYHRLLAHRSTLKDEAGILRAVESRYPEISADVPILTVTSPNSKETAEFLARLAPDVILARCKVILKPEIFRAARTGTLVMHPGICPEYRNAHGCFWALARRDLRNVGMTLLQVDAGIDTGPVYGYYSYPFDELRESHFVIQHRTVFENLDPLRAKLEEIHAGRAQPIDTRGRPSANWGQPWLTSELKRRWRASRQTALLYHDVIESLAHASDSGFAGADADAYKLDRVGFTAQLDAIARGLDPQRAANLEFTFDDGGVTADEPTASLLEERGWRGHFFVVTDRIGQPGFLTADQIRDLHRRGHRIGSHSHTHPAGFSRLSPERMTYEWRRSREILEDILTPAGGPRAVVTTASVPGGFYSRQVALAALDAGYTTLYNSEPEARIKVVRAANGREIRVLGRFGVQRSTPVDRVLALASGALSARLPQWLGWNAKKPLKAIGGGAWFAFRKWMFNRQAQSAQR